MGKKINLQIVEVLGSSPRRPTTPIAQLVRAYLHKIDVQGLIKVRSGFESL